MGRRAVFLDRDGTINEVSVKNGKPFSPRRVEDFKIATGVAEALKFFKSSGFLNIVITNQPDIARGLLDKKGLEKMHEYLRKELAVDDVMVCPHDDDDICDCRKPRPGLILEAARKWGIDLASSYVIGDTHRDIQAGKKAGCKTVLLDKSYNKECYRDYDIKVKSLKEFVEVLKKGEA